MSSSSVPKKIKNMPYKDYFSSNFKPIEVVTGTCIVRKESTNIDFHKDYNWSSYR